jgi:hypothetical protein
MISMCPPIHISPVSLLRSNFFFRWNITFVIPAFARHPFIVKRGIHCMVGSRLIRLHALQVSSIIRIIDPLALKGAICMEGALLFTMGIIAVFMIVIIMITNTILKFIIALQTTAIFFVSEAVIIPFSRSCLVAIIPITSVVHFKYSPTRFIMVHVSLILHPLYWVVLQEFSGMGLARKFFVLLHELSNMSSLQLQLKGKITSLGIAGFRNSNAFPLLGPNNRPGLGEDYVSGITQV